jgi:hypothetical protein
MREPAPPVPTLAELRSASPWFWVYCKQNDCTHKAPMAFVPLIIRRGPDTSSADYASRPAVPAAAEKGATLLHPSYVDRVVGFQPFPVGRLPESAPFR